MYMLQKENSIQPTDGEIYFVVRVSTQWLLMKKIQRRLPRSQVGIEAYGLALHVPPESVGFAIKHESFTSTCTLSFGVMIRLRDRCCLTIVQA